MDSQSEMAISAFNFSDVKPALNPHKINTHSEVPDRLRSAQIQLEEANNLRNALDAYKLGLTSPLNIDKTHFDHVDQLMLTSGVAEYSARVASEVRRTRANVQMSPNPQSQMEYQQARTKAYALWLRQKGYTGEKVRADGIRKIISQLNDKVTLVDLETRTVALLKEAEAKMKTAVGDNTDKTAIESQRNVIRMQQHNNTPGETTTTNKTENTGTTSYNTTIARELDRWSQPDPNNHRSDIVNRQEMESKYRFKEVILGDFVFVAPENTDEFRLKSLVERSKESEKIIGLKLVNRRPIYVTLIPESKYLPIGGGTDATGERIIIDASLANIDMSFSHEFTHAYLGQIYGISNSLIPMEAAAVYFQNLQFPGASKGSQRYLPGEAEIKNISRRGNKVGLSHTAMLDSADQPRLGYDQEYSYVYRYSGYFAEYFINRYGKDKFFSFYEATCSDNMVDTNSGKILVTNKIWRPGTRNRDIIAAAIAATGMDPQRIEEEFDEYIKNKSDSPDIKAPNKISDLLQRLKLK